MSDDIYTTRKEALANGAKYYYPTKPCKYGHLSKRRVSDWGCVKCNRVDYRVAAGKKHQSTNKQASAARTMKWRTNNKDSAKQTWERYFASNKDAITIACAERRATRRVARASWYDSEKDDIKALYERSRQLTEETGIPHHVDHIIPIVNDAVCGLHCLANLQILTAFMNRSKSNQLV